MFCGKTHYRLSFSIWVCLKMWLVYPIVPNGFADHYPYEMAISLGIYPILRQKKNMGERSHNCQVRVPEHLALGPIWPHGYFKITAWICFFKGQDAPIETAIARRRSRRSRRTGKRRRAATCRHRAPPNPSANIATTFPSGAASWGWLGPRVQGAGRGRLQGAAERLVIFWSTFSDFCQNYGKSPFSMGKSTINGHFL